MRKYLIAGNWKMNKDAAEGESLIADIALAVGKQTDVDVVVCPPYTGLESASKSVSDNEIELGAQNMHPAAAGAYTGEVAASMLRHLHVSYVILGHSERRTLFGETDAFINEKVLAAFENNLKPILCVGETIEEREADKTISVVTTQLNDGLKGVTAENAENLVIAYEPVWAIGTGKTATPEMAQEVHQKIREILTDLFGADAANGIQILYGGSMKPENADDLLAQADIDGGLIGGASLKAQSFIQLVESAISKS